MMSSPEHENERAVAAAQAAIPLLKEYTEKLNNARRELHEAYQAYSNVDRALGKSGSSRGGGTDPALELTRNTFQALQQSSRSLVSGATALASFASQKIEYSALESVLQVELRLRLAEFEGAIAALRWLSDSLFS
jgi:hypothetical protein